MPPSGPQAALSSARERLPRDLQEAAATLGSALTACSPEQDGALRALRALPSSTTSFSRLACATALLMQDHAEGAAALAALALDPTQELHAAVGVVMAHAAACRWRPAPASVWSTTKPAQSAEDVAMPQQRWPRMSMAQPWLAAMEGKILSALAGGGCQGPPAQRALHAALAFLDLPLYTQHPGTHVTCMLMAGRCMLRCMLAHEQGAPERAAAGQCVLELCESAERLAVVEPVPGMQVRK